MKSKRKTYCSDDFWNGDASTIHIVRSAETVSSTENLTNHRSVANFDTQSLSYRLSMSANSSLSISRTQDLRLWSGQAQGEHHAQKDCQALWSGDSGYEIVWWLLTPWALPLIFSGGSVERTQSFRLLRQFPKNEGVRSMWGVRQHRIVYKLLLIWERNHRF